MSMWCNITKLRYFLYVVTCTLQLNCYGRNLSCPDQCECRQSIVKCVRADVPKQIPEDTEQVFIRKMDLDILRRGVFKDDSWSTLVSLDISADRGQYLYNKTFVGLDNLRFLGVHGKDLRYMEGSAFNGLESVHTLDFSFNPQLNALEFQVVLFAYKRNQFPLLRNLTVTDMFINQVNTIDLNAQTLKFGSKYKHFRYLDISGLNLREVEVDSFQKQFCKSLMHMKASRITLGFLKNAGRAEVCSSLRTLDISEAHLPFNVQGLNDISCTALRFINNVTTLIVNGIEHLVSNLSLSLDLRRCNFHLRKIVFRNNHLRWINISVNVSDTLQQTISEIDMSSNSIEYIAPNLIYPSIHLERLNLTRNRLSIMQLRYHATFEVLLSRSYKLKELYLAYNMLQGIPKYLFAYNKILEVIDISRNKLTSLNFKFQHLGRLKYLDLHGNMIHFVGETTLDMLGNLYYETHFAVKSTKRNTTNVENTTYFQVNLGANPFRCNCEKKSIQMLDWLETSVFVYRAIMTYTCVFEDQTVDILHSALEIIKPVCDQKHVIDIMTIVIPSVLGIIVIIIVVVILLQVRKRNAKQYIDFVQDLRHDKLAHTFLVFLSFCSEDNDFVLINIAKQLQDKLSEITGNARNFVCIGDHEFQLGLMVHEEVMRCMEESSVVMFIVSNTFCKKNWCKMEVKEAYNQQKPIIMFMKERVETEDMPRILQRTFNRYTHAAWVDDVAGGHCEPNMQRMCESIVEMARRARRTR